MQRAAARESKIWSALSIGHPDRDYNCCDRLLSIAQDMSGLGSTRVVRFLCPARRRGNEPDDVATGPQDEEVSGRIEPLGTEGAVGDGGGGVAGLLGAAVPAVSAALR